MDITNVNIFKNDESEMHMLIETNEDNSIIITPEERWTDYQKSIVEEFEKQFPNGRPLPTPSEPQNEPADSEKIAMAEALIDLDMRLSALENK